MRPIISLDTKNRYRRIHIKHRFFNTWNHVAKEKYLKCIHPPVEHFHGRRSITARRERSMSRDTTSDQYPGTGTRNPRLSTSAASRRSLDLNLNHMLFIR
jgi:hypothetical protein